VSHSSNPRPCGCKSGAACTIVALLGWPVWVVASGLPHEAIGIATAIPAYAGVVIASGFVGKVAGIAVATLRHRAQ
jgi:hypothetical protein